MIYENCKLEQTFRKIEIRIAINNNGIRFLQEGFILRKIIYFRTTGNHFLKNKSLFIYCNVFHNKFESKLYPQYCAAKMPVTY